ncbi:MAG: hypothetical protein ACE5H4_00645 [Candidatus Thorarchaeota archaeon]
MAHIHGPTPDGELGRSEFLIEVNDLKKESLKEGCAVHLRILGGPDASEYGFRFSFYQ